MFLRGGGAGGAGNTSAETEVTDGAIVQRETSICVASERQPSGGSSSRKTRSRQDNEEGQEDNTANSSPLTSDDEGEKEEGANGAGGKLKRKREVSQASETGHSDTHAGSAMRRSTRARNRSTTPASSPSRSVSPLTSLPKPPSSSVGGIKVWAKMETHPHYPALAFYNESDIPRSILNSKRGGTIL